MRGALAQLGAHNTGSVGVRGSNPLCSTKKRGRCTQLHLPLFLPNVKIGDSNAMSQTIR